MPNCEVYFSKMPVDTKPKIHEGRKSSKPLMEKRRRARINDSLSQLKSLILEATNKDSSRHSKLEKADILEMTVKHLRTVQRSHISAPHGGDPGRFRQGYSECIHEVARFLTNIENIGSTDMRVTLINHLANACSPPTPSSPASPQQPSPPTSPVATSPIGAMQQAQPMVSYAGQQVTAPSPAIASAAGNCNAAQVPSQPIRVQISPAVSSPASATTANVITAAQLQQQKFVQSRIEAASPIGSIATTHVTNTIAAPAQVFSGFPVGIPGTLPTGGEITLVLPPQALAGGQLPSHFIPVYAQSAPVLTSPTISPASQGPVHVAVSSPESSPKAYARVQFSPSPISPPQQHHHQQLTTVQTPTLVAVPAPAPAPVMQHHTKVAFQTVQHPQPPSPPKTMLQAVHMQQQQVCKEEPVWRPWNHMK